jgi:hypothetical protein
MGLDLRGTPVTSSRTQERTRKALDILAEIQEQVAQMGLPEYPRPDNVPQALADIDVGALSNRELETQMAAYIAWGAYVSTKLAEAEVAYRASTINMKAIAASLKVSLFKDQVPKAEIDARVHVAPEYVDQELEHLKLYATKEILAAHYKAYSKQAGALSRFVELRKLEYEQEMRSQNVAGYRRPTGGLPASLRRGSPK